MYRTLSNDIPYHTRPTLPALGVKSVPDCVAASVKTLPEIAKYCHMNILLTINISSPGRLNYFTLRLMTKNNFRKELTAYFSYGIYDLPRLLLHNFPYAM